MPHWITVALPTLFVGALAAGIGLAGQVSVLREQVATAKDQVRALETEKSNLSEWTSRLDERLKAAERELGRIPRCPAK